MTSQVTIRKVESRQDFQLFFEFPWRLYKNDPNWTPPLLSMRHELLDKDKNPVWQYSEGDYFLALRDGVPVGTIAAFVNHRHNDYNKENVGWFGTFEVEDDPEAASALLNTASDWVRERGYDAIRGPQSFTTHEECGLLIENFDPAVLLMPYNPPYYQEMVENAGFEKSMDVKSVYIDREILRVHNMPERLGRLVDRAAKRSGIVMRKMDYGKKDQEFKLFKELYNAAWEDNWGFTPFTDAELDNLVESLGRFLDPRFAFFAEVKGEPAGFVLSIPDLNAVLRKVKAKPGTPEVLSLLKALWYWKINGTITGLRMPLLGVKKEFRNRGVELAMFLVTIQAILDTEIQWMDAGWVLETNELLKICTSLGMELYKTHRFYVKTF